MLDQALPEHVSGQEQRYNQIAGIWTLLLEQFTLFCEGVGAPRCLPTLRARYLCLKPTGQLIVIAVVALALRTRELSLTQVVERLNQIPWDIDQPHWQNIAVVDGRINGTVATIALASYLVAYLIGLPLSDTEVQKLEVDYRKAKRQETAALPQPLFPKSSKE